MARNETGVNFRAGLHLLAMVEEKVITCGMYAFNEALRDAWREFFAQFEKVRSSGFELEFGEAITLTSPWHVFRQRPSIWHGIRMRPFGHRLRPSLMTSGVHVVMRANGRLEGGADPRREGVARGD